jgi:hypothetical protein
MLAIGVDLSEIEAEWAVPIAPSFLSPLDERG